MTHDGQCLLCDFGLSHIKHEITQTLTIASHGGHQRFLAPEICDPETEETRVNESSDIYSLAMAIYALGTRSMPFEGFNNGHAHQAAVQGERPSKPDSLGGLMADDTKLLWSLMERMWNGRPELRPTIASVRDVMKGIPMWLGSTPIPALSRGSYPSPPTAFFQHIDTLPPQALVSGNENILGPMLPLRYASCKLLLCISIWTPKSAVILVVVCGMMLCKSKWWRM